MFHGNVSLEIAQGLLKLRARIEAAKIPSSKLDETLNIATWNIREFGKKPRTEAAIHYIAEIIGQFDLVGIVELRENLGDLERLLPILGPYWDAVYSDAIPDPGGNDERICFLYDGRACAFNGMAARATAPRTKKGTEYLPEEDWWRPPYLATFKAGNYGFMALSVHARWGDSDDARTAEIQRIAAWLEAKIKSPYNEDQDVIVMGDFNIPSRTSPMFKALTSTGLTIPTALLKDDFGSNLARDKRYDQILHYARYPADFTLGGGVLDFYASDHKPLFPNLTKQQFTFQMSDHLPLWVQIRTDIDDFKLDELIQSKRK